MVVMDSGPGPLGHPRMTRVYLGCRFAYTGSVFSYLWRNALDSIAYVNGAFVPLSEAKVSILDRGFLFADGIYEVSAVLDGKLVDNASHLARLKRSVGEIALELPEPLERRG